MRHPTAASVVLFAACSAGPPLPPTPSAAMRSEWQRVVVRVVSPATGCELDAPPTTLPGRALVGAGKGALIGVGVGAGIGYLSPEWGVVLVGAGALLGGLGGLLVGPLCGESAADVEAGVATLRQAVAEADPGAQLGVALTAALQLRGVEVVDGAAIVCELRLAQVGLLGAPDFDPELAPSLQGEVCMRRGVDGAALHCEPFACATLGQPFTTWLRTRGAVRGAFGDASRQLADFLADELVRNTDIHWVRN